MACTFAGMARMVHARENGRRAVPGAEYRKLILILLAAFAVAALALAFLRLVGEGWLTNGSAIASPLGWTLPLMTAFVVVGVAWLLMSQSHGKADDDGFDMSTVACPACGSSVLREWRLCPYCTVALDDDAGHEEPQTGE